MPSIADTVTETIQWVFPEHAGAPGQIHGGRMMQWITQAGTMAAARVARGTVLLGAMDDIDFLHPVKVGEIAILRARVEYIGTSSLEVAVRVWAENVATGARAVTLNSHLVFVSVDEQERPRAVGSKIEPRAAAEQEEVGVKVLAEQPWSGEVRHACTAYLTYVHLGGDLRPQACRPFTPRTEGERRRWQGALARRERRLERVKRLKAALSNERG